jgi:Prenyltransferase and squalene oxidase repeat
MKPRFILILTLITALIGFTRITAPIAQKEILTAATKSLSLLQVSGQKFIARSPRHCVSCHHNLLTALAEDQCRQKGIPFTDSFRTERTRATVGGIRSVANMNHPADFLPAKFAPAYALIALHADHYAPDNNTEITVDYLIHQQQPDGSFAAEYGRPPQEGGEAHLAALCIHAIRLYAAPAKADLINQEVAKTRHWFNTYHSEVQQEVAFQLLGLTWCDAPAEEKTVIASRLLQLQRPDGSWSQLTTMPGDAYATGQALYALAESKTLKPSDEAYQKGLAWLLKTQEPTGAWIVQTRAYPIQPHLNTDFPPYDENQFISAAGSNWATMALLDALPDPPATAKK